MVVDKNISKSYNDILVILSMLDKKYIDLLPKGLIKYFRDNSDKCYFSNIKFNIPLSKQKLSEETEALLCLLTVNYWVNGKEKNEFIENYNKNEEELKNKYKTNFFWENDKKNAE